MSADPAAHEGDSTAWLLADSQTRLGPAGKSVYVHSAKLAVDSRGVTATANLSIGFDPSYQHVTLHAIDVVRAGKRLKRLNVSPIKVLQRETELEYLIYDGSKTISVLLDDVRVGDIVEYAYTLDGMNPVFQNKFAGAADLQWSVPVDRVHVRLLVPAGRSIAIAPHNTALTPEVRELGGYRDYRWDVRDQGAAKVDENTPSWFDPYAYLEWSEFRDWSAVVQWALPLYRVPGQLSAALQAEIARIGKEHAEPAARVSAVLRTVQRDIRYLGIEVGQGSHAPSSPSLVYQRRFGDCKDKAMLAVTMLRALGIKAAPALVNSQTGKAVAQAIAGPNAFNHVLVRVELDGKTYWLDPTRPLQVGDLTHIAQADYGFALVLAEGVSALSPMAGTSLDRKSVYALIDSSAGMDKPASYRIETTVTGNLADEMRRSLAGKNREKTARKFLNYYAADYAGITVAAPLMVQDDEQTNTVKVMESYSITNFWPRSTKKAMRVADISSAVMADYLRAPRSLIRDTPLSVRMPDEVQEIMEIKLPHSWKLKLSDTSIKDPAFEFSNRVTAAEDNKVVLLTTSYRALADHVKVADVASYAEKLRDANDALGYRLTSKDPEGAADIKPLSPPAWRLVIIGALVTLCGALALRLQSSAPAHLPINRKLLAAFVAVSGIVSSLLADQIVLPLFCVIVLFHLCHKLLSQAAEVPATHQAYRLARRFVTGEGKLRQDYAFTIATTSLICFQVIAMGAVIYFGANGQLAFIRPLFGE